MTNKTDKFQNREFIVHLAYCLNIPLVKVILPFYDSLGLYSLYT